MNTIMKTAEAIASILENNPVLARELKNHIEQEKLLDVLKLDDSTYLKIGLENTPNDEIIEKIKDLFDTEFEILEAFDFDHTILLGRALQKEGFEGCIKELVKIDSIY